MAKCADVNCPRLVVRAKSWLSWANEQELTPIEPCQSRTPVKSRSDESDKEHMHIISVFNSTKKKTPAEYQCIREPDRPAILMRPKRNQHHLLIRAISTIFRLARMTKSVRTLGESYQVDSGRSHLKYWCTALVVHRGPAYKQREAVRKMRSASNETS